MLLDVGGWVVGSGAPDWVVVPFPIVTRSPERPRRHSMNRNSLVWTTLSLLGLLYSSTNLSGCGGGNAKTTADTEAALTA